MSTIAARTKSAEDTQALAVELAPLARAGDIVVLAGDLGAGKTVFVKGFASGLGVTEAVVSPTFVFMRSYRGRIPLVHLDVYRLEHLQEAIDLGLAEILDDGAVTLIEWGDLVEGVLPADFLEVRLERSAGDDDREVHVRAVGQAWSARLGAVRRALERWAINGA